MHGMDRTMRGMLPGTVRARRKRRKLTTSGARTPRSSSRGLPADPVARDVLPAAARVHPAGAHVLVAGAAHLPPAGVPDVLAAVPSVVAADPEVPRAGRAARALVAHGGRRVGRVVADGDRVSRLRAGERAVVRLLVL